MSSARGEATEKTQSLLNFKTSLPVILEGLSPILEGLSPTEGGEGLGFSRKIRTIS